MLFKLFNWIKINIFGKALVRVLLVLSAVAAVVFFAIKSRGPIDPVKQSQGNPAVGFRPGVDPKDYALFGDRISGRAEDELKKIRSQFQQLDEKYSGLAETLRRKEEQETRMSQELRRLREEVGRAPQPAGNQDPQKGAGPRPESDPKQDGNPFDFSSPDGVTQVLARIQKISTSPRTLAPTKKVKVARIPAGAFAKAKLLTGVYAPVNSTALPVLMRIESIGWGPNRSRIQIREGFIVGKAQGDPNSARAIIQLQTLSLVLDDGKTIELPINGYVTDSDGIQGVSGTYVYRMNEIIGLSTTASVLAKGADAFAQRNVTTSVGLLGNVTQVLKGNALEYSGLQVASGTLNKLSEVVARRADEIVPAVYTPNGKTITAIFLEGVDIQGLIPQQDAGVADPYGSLDAHK